MLLSLTLLYLRTLENLHAVLETPFAQAFINWTAIWCSFICVLRCLCKHCTLLLNPTYTWMCMPLSLYMCLQVIKNTLNPVWPPFEVSSQTLCGSDPDRKIKVSGTVAGMESRSTSCACNSTAPSGTGDLLWLGQWRGPWSDWCVLYINEATHWSTAE